MPADPKKCPRYALFTIVELDDSKTLWRRIGSAFTNRDGSFNLFLEALPVNGKVHMRVIDPSSSSSE